MGKTVKVESIGLLEELERKGMLYFLRKVEENEKGVPVYCFSGTKKVYKIIQEYNTKHNNELPEINPWGRYHKLIEFSATDMISTRNRTLVKRFFRAGYACCLYDVDYDPVAQKQVFRFFANDEMLKMKEKVDAECQERYSLKQESVDLHTDIAQVKKMLETLTSLIKESK